MPHLRWGTSGPGADLGSASRLQAPKRLPYPGETHYRHRQTDGAALRLRFRRDKGGERRTFELELAPRSGYVLAGPARTAWQHHVPLAKSLRYSITFRTLR